MCDFKDKNKWKTDRGWPSFLKNNTSGQHAFVEIILYFMYSYLRSFYLTLYIILMQYPTVRTS